MRQRAEEKQGRTIRIGKTGKQRRNRKEEQGERRTRQPDRVSLEPRKSGVLSYLAVSPHFYDRCFVRFLWIKYTRRDCPFYVIMMFLRSCHDCFI